MKNEEHASAQKTLRLKILGTNLLRIKIHNRHMSDEQLEALISTN